MVIWRSSCDVMTVNCLRVSFALIALTSITKLVVYVFFVYSGGSRTSYGRPTTRQDTFTAHRQMISRPSAVQRRDKSPSPSAWKSEPCARRFAEVYQRYCEQSLHPQTSNVLPVYMNLSSRELSAHLCPCVPDHLRKYNNYAEF